MLADQHAALSCTDRTYWRREPNHRYPACSWKIKEGEAWNVQGANGNSSWLVWYRARIWIFILQPVQVTCHTVSIIASYSNQHSLLDNYHYTCICNGPLIALQPVPCVFTEARLFMLMKFVLGKYINTVRIKHTLIQDSKDVGLLSGQGRYNHRVCSTYLPSSNFANVYLPLHSHQLSLVFTRIEHCFY